MSRQKLSGRRKHNRAQIAKFCEHVRETRNKSTAGSKVDTMEFTGKPESESPMSFAGETHMDHEDTRHAARLLTPIIEEKLRRWRSDLYYLVERAPLEAQGWKAGKTQEARETLYLYDAALDWLEDRFERRHPGVRIEVPVDPKSEPVASKMEARDRDRRLGREHADRILYSRYLAVVEENPGITKKAAMSLVSEREDKSVPTIERAIAFCRRGEEGAA